MNHYLIRADMTISERWVLGDINHINNWYLIEPPVNFMEPGSYSLSVTHPGREVDYSLAGYASAPVVSERLFSALRGLAEVDEPYENVVFEPVTIVGQETDHKYFLMIVETQVDCIDEARSEFVRFDDGDVARPDLAGQIRAFFKMTLDEDRTESRHVFRLKGYPSALIVSDEVKRRIEAAGAVGLSFERVSGH
ncbi:imm11 family protein [Stenotrophomonas sp. SrG]|uniref:imm11 family protein n=1 Tax=Stenotrophomonas sp. SrG TaxID=3414430 RepID=UPI003CE831A0